MLGEFTSLGNCLLGVVGDVGGFGALNAQRAMLVKTPKHIVRNSRIL